jgi:hypothetical protein
VATFFGIVYFAYVVGAVALFLLLVRAVSKRRSRWAPGPAASGTVYELLNEDKRNAIEIILEERAEYTDPETKDGVLPRPRERSGALGPRE